MIIPDKTYTSNPFVDNIIYYAKWLAMNCTVKDEQEALSNETKETLEAGDLLIACIESSSTYEMFPMIPKEILEKYIPVRSNLDVYTDSADSLRIHLNHYTLGERTILLNKLSQIAREVYQDHYEIMTNYIEEIGLTWIDDNEELYNRCKDGSATYEDLFSIMPEHTRKRIVKQYLNNYDSTRLDVICSNLVEFNQYIANRTDVQIDTELENISDAMRKVFVSHYEMMIERKYVNEAYETWVPYINVIDIYDRCKRGAAKYEEIFELIPEETRLELLIGVIGSDVTTYNLNSDIYALEEYLKDQPNANYLKSELTKVFTNNYLSNYNAYINYSIYAACNTDALDYFDLIPYLPRETQKMILNTQFDEYTNLEVFEENKKMLDRYLFSIPTNEANTIREAINKDMRVWYPANHQEYNNYYRALIGLPPVGEDHVPYVDTLVHSWDPKTKTFKEFGDRFIKQLPTEIYPEIHWKSNIYEFDSYDIGILNEYGILDDYVAACGSNISDPRYRYLRYLAENKLDLYQCRRAMKFQLIGIPTVDDDDARRRFVDIYTVNRDYVIRTVYSDAHTFQSDYYDKFMIIFTLINTIMDMLGDVSNMIIDREVFDSRCIKWLFESYGVPYYSEIPIKYLRAMLKNLNTLLKYKSSTKNMIDICNLFGFSDVRVFGYYLFKERGIVPGTGEYVFDEDNDIAYDIDKLWIQDPAIEDTSKQSKCVDYNGIKYASLFADYSLLDDYIEDTVNVGSKTRYIVKKDANVFIRGEQITDSVILDNVHSLGINTNEYPVYEFMTLKTARELANLGEDTDLSAAELKFIKVPIDEEVTEYKNDPNYIIPYDEIVYNDEGDTWDGGLDHEDLYQALIDHAFNAVKTKYISVETVTDLTEQCFQVAYFYNMLFDNLYSEEALTVKIPFIKIDHDFKFMDVICYLFALMYFYNDLEDNIMYSPTQILYIKGYNFDEALNEIMDDPKAFTQEPDLGERENIFDVNERIAEDGYDYRQMFNGYNIRGFNLEADIDELEEWLNNYCQMSLDDFIVDDSLTNFSQVITLRQFFSLHNSYYQKDIFKDAIAPLPYNQNIKSAYDALLYKRESEQDMDDYTHSFVPEGNYYMEVIDDKNDIIFVTDYKTYIIMPDKTPHALYTKYIRDDHGRYNCAEAQYYFYNRETKEFQRLFDDEIYIVNAEDQYVFASNAFYTKNEETGEFSEVTDPKYFVADKYETDRRRLIFGEYWIQNEDGKWVIDPDQAYVWVEVNGEGSYKPWSEVSTHENITISEDDCWIKHSDGHFIKFTETDYYKNRTLDGENSIYEFMEEACYIESDTPTDEQDTDLQGVTRYFKKLADFYYENNWIYRDGLFIKDSTTGEYISEKDLLSPGNCYYLLAPGRYDLVVENYAVYTAYKKPRKVSYILVLQSDNDYSRLKLSGVNYIVANNLTKRYIFNSDPDYVTVLLPDATYDQTKSMIVVFNKEVTVSNASELDEPSKYNPEETDRVWDENDWFYPDPAYATEDIGMHGENIWYYRKPGGDTVVEDEINAEPVGSGFYMESTAYIGTIHLEKGKKYYMAFDIETNFTGKMQIFNTADDSVEKTTDRVYEVAKMEKQHVSQVFIANDEETPDIRFLIYDFEQFPINIGDYVIVSNIRFIRAYSDNFIAQDIPSYDKIQELYRTNEAIYKYLAKLMAEETDFYTYNIYKKIYDALMISKYNKEAFKIGDNKYARTYTEFLENRDAVLYSKLARFKSLDPDTMHKEIADEIIEVTYAIDDCVDTYTYGFLYSYFPAVSANYIQQYITKIINWFKSWKVHLLGINTVYKLGDPMENTVKILEDQQYRNKFDFERHNVHVHDTIKINPLDDTNISGVPYTDLYDLEDPNLALEDICRIRDRVRVISRTANRIEYRDPENDLHLVFNDDGIMVGIEEGNKLKISATNAGFSTTNNNDLVMTTDESEQQAFAHQIIDEINLTSGDFIEWRELLEDE